MGEMFALQTDWVLGLEKVQSQNSEENLILTHQSH